MIADHTPVALTLTDPSRVGEARRLVVRLGQLAGIDTDTCSRIALVTTELATNLLKHARQGELLARVFKDSGRTGVELTSVDRGPGMADPEQCFRDGYSTAGSPGTGLGAVRRVADYCEVYSLVGAGTVIVARVGAVGLRSEADAIDTGVLLAPYPGETVCGDALAVESSAAQSTFLAVDGLGHGPHAAAAAAEAVRVFHENASAPLADLLVVQHGALQKTRGAAVALVRLDHAAGALDFCGVGNIAVFVARYGALKALASAGGIVGGMLPRLQVQRMAWQPHDVLVMQSDGLVTPGKFFQHPGLLARHPAVIAGMIYGQLKRGRDDASVLVARLRDQP